MSYDTDIECGEELERDLLSGFLKESDLTESGKRKLYAYRNSPHGHLETFTEFDARTRLSLDIETKSDADLEFLGFPVDKTPDTE